MSMDSTLGEGPVGGPGVRTVSAKDARELILSGRAPAGLVVRDPGAPSLGTRLRLEGCPGLETLPPGLRVPGELNLSGCTALAELPPELKDDVTDAAVDASFLDLSGCTALTELPGSVFAQARFSYGVSLRGCTALRSLPDGLRVEGDLDLSGCTGLTRLPVGLWVGERLDLSGCSGLAELPDDLHVGAEMEVAGTRLRSLPESLRHVRLTWDEVEVDERVALTPEVSTAREILDEPDDDRRRVMVGRLGIERLRRKALEEGIDPDRLSQS
jgi:hypothetical protein